MDEEKAGPDSSKAQAVDSFFEAVLDGDEKGIAAALRKVGELRGFPLTYLADVLDPAAVDGKNPWRIEFQKPTKGRPKKSKPQLSPFLRYLSIRAAGRATNALRSRKRIAGSELALLADLFDPCVELPESFSSRLKLVSNRAGRPVNKLKKGARDFYWRRVFTSVIKKQPKNVVDFTFQVFKRLKAENEKISAAGRKPNALPSHSTIRNNMKRLGFLPKM